MNRRFVRFAFAATFGALVLVGTVALAQSLPACVAGTSQSTCAMGNVIYSNPTGVFAGSNRFRAQAGIISDPFNPGFSTGNIAEATTSGQLSNSGSFTVTTLSGLPAIAGLSVSSTCGVTGSASANVTVSTGNGQPVSLSCSQFQTMTGTSTVSRTISLVPVSSLTVSVTASGSISAGSVTWTDISGQLSLNPVYYFPHLAFGSGYQTTLTYVNYSTQAVTCQTRFLSDAGAALTVPFTDGTASNRTDTMQPGASIHVQTQAPATTNGGGWAEAQCTGPVQASLLYRYFSNGTPQGEAGVNAMSAPAREFVTFAESHTGIAWANPTNVQAAVTITAIDAATGRSQGATTFNLAPNAHRANNIGPMLNLPGTFNGSVQITSTVPIVSLSLNAEAFPVFSSLPPGDLADGTTLNTP